VNFQPHVLPLGRSRAAVETFRHVVDARRRVEALDHWKSREDFDSIIIVQGVLTSSGIRRSVSVAKVARTGEEKRLYSTFKDVSKRADLLVQKGEYARPWK